MTNNSIFLHFFEQQRIIFSKKRFLLAVSGGLDSMVLVDFFVSNNFCFEIAHCNFQLRGDEADGDQKLVSEEAQRRGVKFHTINFETGKFATERKIGIQEAARELRYNWLEEIRVENKLDYIVTAHHADDQIETILFNFIRGTGIRGLRGILGKRDKIIRPLLAISKKELMQISQEKNISFREDSSNLATKYSRNKIRKELIPLIESINPAFSDTIQAQQQIYEQLEIVYNQTIEKQKAKLFLKVSEDEYRIPILLLKKSPISSSFLFEFLSDFGFNKSQVDDIVQSLASPTSGKQFLSENYRLIKDRMFLILTKSNSKSATTYSIDITAEEGSLQFDNHELKWSKMMRENISINPAKNFCYLDTKELGNALTLRHWSKGDYFYPFGMKLKKKKVSKYFKDQKIAINDKEKIWILQSDKRIAWVLKNRSDERFRVSDKTEKVLVLEFIER
jgi:tRNA(Ile)-lysidine synthase